MSTEIPLNRTSWTTQKVQFIEVSGLQVLFIEGIADLVPHCMSNIEGIPV